MSVAAQGPPRCGCCSRGSRWRRRRRRRRSAAPMRRPARAQRASFGTWRGQRAQTVQTQPLASDTFLPQDLLLIQRDQESMIFLLQTQPQRYCAGRNVTPQSAATTGFGECQTVALKWLQSASCTETQVALYKLMLLAVILADRLIVRPSATAAAAPVRSALKEQNIFRNELAASRLKRLGQAQLIRSFFSPAARLRVRTRLLLCGLRELATRRIHLEIQMARCVWLKALRSRQQSSLCSRLVVQIGLSLCGCAVLRHHQAC